MKGNVINRVLENSNTKPEVGMYFMYTQYVDRKVFRVVEMISPKEIKIQYLEAKADPSKGPLSMGHQDWVFEDTEYFVVLKFKYGQWRTSNGTVYKGYFSEKPNYYYCWEF